MVACERRSPQIPGFVQTLPYSCHTELICSGFPMVLFKVWSLQVTSIEPKMLDETNQNKPNVFFSVVNNLQGGNVVISLYQVAQIIALPPE